MKVLFHSNQLSLRGTEVALYDYAHYNEELLGNQSLIAIPEQGDNHPYVKKKFEKRFKVHYYACHEELCQIASANAVNVFYAIKAGKNDGIFIPGVKNCIHAVFKHHDPHGDVYAYVSEWLSEEMSGGKRPYVPHMINLPVCGDNLREKLGIPDNAIVFGRYGGKETFDLQFAKRAVYSVAKKRPDIYFLFMNTDDFVFNQRYFKKKFLNYLVSPIAFSEKTFPNIIFLKGVSEPLAKVKFIQTCDAMLHARKQGESFGIACGEFSIKNKPVITCNGSFIKERSHIEILGNKGIYYTNRSQLEEILLNFYPQKQSEWDAYSEFYDPVPIMKKFKEVFLDA